MYLHVLFVCFFFQHGVAACLMYLDFFSIAAQRAALSVTSNCSQNVLPEEFNFIQPSLHLLSTRLNNTVYFVFIFRFFYYLFNRTV